eukprot:Pgem_evm1s11874
MNDRQEKKQRKNNKGKDIETDLGNKNNEIEKNEVKNSISDNTTSSKYHKNNIDSRVNEKK